MKTCDNVTALARELGIRRKFLYLWRDQALASAGSGSSLNAKQPVEARERKRIAELERLVARQALAIDFFKGALQRVEELRRKREQTFGAASTSKSGKQTGSKANSQ